MTKYKLIKEYPKSPKLGFEISFNDTNCWSDGAIYFYKKELEKHTEFWEEVIDMDALLIEAKRRYPIGTSFKSENDNNKIRVVATYQDYKKLEFYESMSLGERCIRSAMSSSGGNCSNPAVYINGRWAEIIEKPVEKDYEILSFSQGSGTLDLWINVNGNYSRNGKDTTPAPVEYFISNDFYSIHSIKRLSDGEIFTIGDKVQNSNYNLNWTNCFISKFVLNTNSILFGITQEESYSTYQLNILNHKKNPLFTTEDKVDIYEGDKYFYIWTEKPEDLDQPMFQPIEFTAKQMSGGYSDKAIFFSTKEKAQEYIDSKRIKVEDGYLYEGQESYSVKKACMSLDRFSIDEIKDGADAENAKWIDFATKEARDKYIEDNKPMYSKQDMIDFVYHYSNENRSQDGIRYWINEWTKKKCKE